MLAVYIMLPTGQSSPNLLFLMLDRLKIIFDELVGVINQHKPNQAAIEQIFVAKSAGSALRLGMARGVGLLACGVNGLKVGEISGPGSEKGGYWYWGGRKNRYRTWLAVCWR